MILTTHLLAGGLVASLCPEIKLPGIWLLAYATHLGLDRLPHWDYRLELIGQPAWRQTWQKNKLVLIKDLSKISLDLVLGLALSYLIFSKLYQVEIDLLIVGLSGGIMPDVLQFAYSLYPRRPFTWTQALHNFCHWPKNNRPQTTVVFPWGQVGVVSLLLIGAIFN